MEALNVLNQNTYMAAFSMLCMNLGSRYIALDISKAQEQILKHQVFRRITLFCIFYVATRHILISFMLTFVFILINSCILHEESMFCILPPSARKVDASKISAEEYAAAKKVVDAYEAEMAPAKGQEASSMPVMSTYAVL